jgi:archaellum component FlaF (FlaF/FlaG flagellin family)
LDINMKDLLKGKIATGAVVVITIVLAGIAVFTAIRLYQLRTESVSPASPAEPFAWDCKNYTFAVSGDGTVIATNNSSRSEPSQKADVYVNGSLVATLDVPALSPGQNATLGKVDVPGGSFNWRVAGSKDCASEGTTTGIEACKELRFSISSPSSTPTSTPTGTITPTISPTSTPTGTPGPTSTSTPGPTSTPTTGVGGGPSSTPTSTPTPTQGVNITTTPTNTQIAQASPTTSPESLPAAGTGYPTVILSILGLLIIFFAIALAV